MQPMTAVHARILGRTGVSELGFGGAPAGIPNYLGRWDPGGSAEARALTEAVHRFASSEETS
jgi:hypothetical protein